MTRLVLIGPRGAGKTAAGRRAAAFLGVDFVDTDTLIEARGQPIPEIFATRGEAGFRDLEREVIRTLVPAPGAVVATGGGVVLDPRNRECVRAWGLVVYLWAAPEILAARIEGSGRPRLAGGDALEETRLVLAEREPIYRALADAVIDTGTLDVEGVAERLGTLAPNPRDRA